MSTSTELARYTVNDISAMAKSVAESRMFGMDHSQAMTLMLLCQAKGIHPIEAVQRYHVIAGRPAMKADAMLADFQAAGGNVKWVERSNTAWEGLFSHPEHAPEPLPVRFTIDDAKKAELLKNAMWTKYPSNMLRARVISNAIRTVMPGIVAGIYTPEEVADMEPVKATARIVTDEHGSDHDARREAVNETFPSSESQPSNDEPPPPRSGKALFAWTKEQEQRYEIGLLRYLNGWAKLQDFPGRMIDWDHEQVALAYAEACRKIQSLTGSPEPNQATTSDEESWEDFLSRTVHVANSEWDNEQAEADVPAEHRKPLANEHQVVNEVCTRAVNKGLIQPQSVTKNGQPDGPRDPAKAKASVHDLYYAKSKKVANTVSTYLAEKLSEARLALAGQGDSDHDSAPSEALQESLAN